MRATASNPFTGAFFARCTPRLHYNKRYSKCAGVVGEVLGKYHPHGDTAVYDALVRLAQPWNLSAIR